MQAQILINSLNIISEKIFKSLEDQIYKILDKIVVINPDILKQEPLKNIFFDGDKNTIILIANSLLIFFVLQYIIKQLISMYNGDNADGIWRFIIKIIIVSCFVSNSYYICEQILEIFSYFSDVIVGFVKDISGKDVTFELLKEKVMKLDGMKNTELLSLNGIIKSMLSVGMISILVNFSIRYVTIIFLIIISPFAIITTSSRLTVGIFYSWIKNFIMNLFIQIITKLIIVIPIMYKSTSDIMYKIILLGSVYILYRINNFTKDIFARISMTK